MPHLIENFFCKLKEFRRIAARYEKTDTSYSAMIPPRPISNRSPMNVHTP